MYLFASYSLSQDNNTSSNRDCDIWNTGNTATIIQGVGGGLGAITCTVALVFVLVSRFYKDIVQRLILYKLVTMIIFSLSQVMCFKYDDGSNTFKAIAIAILHITYSSNVVFTFWLTITLYLCIVYLKELKNFKKLELIAFITLCLAIAAYIPFAKDDPCTQIIHYVVYGTAGALYLITSVLVVIIFIVTIRRSQRHHQRQEDSEAESLLVTNNKWKILSKQLLPLVVYPIVNAVIAMVFLLSFFSSHGVQFYLDSLVSSSGLITGTIVIMHLCILKCKKQRERKKMKKNNKQQQESFCVVPSNHNDVFTKETVASTNARTTYQYTRTLSLTTVTADDQLPIN
uniref:G-protein coupled receptors family 2 profile 2 domain-containing protein n=1 Tax=Amphimedon queenslandica TaxID=400682 RepID=A0A1X7TGX5_AMPQE